MAKEIATRCHDDQTLLRFVRIVASAMDAGNPFTHGRAYRCSKQALALGKEAGLSDSTLLDLEYAALLQDLGKRVVLHGLLQKEGPLDSHERDRMESSRHRTSATMGRANRMGCPVRRSLPPAGSWPWFRRSTP